MKYDERGRIILGTVGEFLCNYLKTGYSGVMTFERYLALQRRDGIEEGVGLSQYMLGLCRIYGAPGRDQGGAHGGNDHDER